MIALPHALIAYKLIFKARFLLLVLGAACVMVLAMLLSSYFGGRQPVTVALDIGVSVMRLLVSFIMVLMVQELFSREFDKKYYFTAMAYPKSRVNLVLCRFTTILLFLLVLVAFLGLIQLVVINLIASIYPQATPVSLGREYVAVLSFMAVDVFVLTALAFFLSMVASTQSFVLIGTLGFMLVARSYGSIVQMLDQNAGVVTDAEAYGTGIGTLVYLLPDLGALDIRMSALYGRAEFIPENWLSLIVGCVVYALGFVALAVWVSQRKRFS